MGATLSSRVATPITEEEDIEAWVELKHSKHPLFRKWSIEDVRYASSRIPGLADLEQLRGQVSACGQTDASHLAGHSRTRCSWLEYFEVVEQTEDHRARRVEVLRRWAHPGTGQYAMEKDAQAVEDMQEYHRLIAGKPVHEFVIDDTYSSDEESSDEESETDELIDDDPQPADKDSAPQKFVRREVKPTFPPSFDPAIRSPVFFGYSTQKCGSFPKGTEIEENERSRQDEAMRRKLSKKEEEINSYDNDMRLRREKREERVRRLEEHHRIARKQRAVELVELEQSRDLPPLQRRLAVVHQHNVESQASDAAANTEILSIRKANEASSISEQETLQLMKDDLKRLRDLESKLMPVGDKLVNLLRQDIKRCDDDLGKATDALDEAKIKLDAVQEDFRSRRFKRLGAAQRSVHMFAERRVEEAERQVEMALQDIHQHEILLQRAVRRREREDEILPLFSLLGAETDLGSISSSDLLLAIAVICGDGLVNKVSFLVDIFDKDRNGFLCPTELRSYLSRISLILNMLGIIRSQLEPDEVESIVLRACASTREFEADSNLGLTCYETRQWTRRSVSRNVQLAAAFGVPRELGEWSTVQVRLTNSVRRYEMGLFNTSDLKIQYLHSELRFRPSLDPERKLAVHSRALSMGNDDPTKQNYSKFLPRKRRALKQENSVPLHHGHLANAAFCQQQTHQNAALKVQTLFRSHRARIWAGTLAKKKARAQLSNDAIDDMRQKAEFEIQRRETMTGLAKLAWDATVMSRQTELKAQGRNLSREEVVHQIKSEVESASLDLMRPQLREIAIERGLDEVNQNVHVDIDERGHGVSGKEMKKGIRLDLGRPSQSLDHLVFLVRGLDSSMTELKAKTLVSEFPSKQLLFQYVSSWQNMELLAEDLAHHFHFKNNAATVASKLLDLSQSSVDWGGINEFCHHLLPPETPLRTFTAAAKPGGGEEERISSSVSLIHEKWTERFFAACGSPEDTAALARAKYSEIERLCDDFLNIARKRAIVIVEELFLPLHMKTIVPYECTPADGRAMEGGRGFQGKRYKYKSGGVCFRVMLDDHGIFDGSNENAQKMGGHEVRGSREYMKCVLNIGDSASIDIRVDQCILVPLQACVDFCGFRVLATAELPISESKMILGTNDRGKTVLNKDPALDKILAAYAGKVLNLARHDVKGENDIVSHSVHSSVDIRGFKKQDGGGFYLTNFWRSYPSENPAATPHLQESPRGMSIFWRMLRPEFVARYDCPLSPDANCQISSDCQEHVKESLKATRHLLSEHIRLLCRRLMQKQLGNKALSGYGLDITAEMHSHGINIRHMGVLRSHISASEDFRTQENADKLRHVLLAEMSTRAIKNLARQYMRQVAGQLKAISDKVQVTIIIGILNLISGSHKKSRSFWNQQVLPRILETFGDVAILDAERSRLFEVMHSRGATIYIIRRFVNMMGIKMTQDCSARMLDHEKIRFSTSDVTSPGLRIKHNIPIQAFAEAMVKIHEAREVLSTKYQHHITDNAPLVYLPLSDSRGLQFAHNLGSLGEGFVARYTGGVDLGNSGPLLHERKNDSAFFDRSQRCRIEASCLSETPCYSVEFWAKVTIGCPGTNRTAIMTSRCAVVATRMERWAFVLFDQGAALEFDGPLIKEGTWEHLAVTVDGQEASFYVNASVCARVDVRSTAKVKRAPATDESDIVNIEAGSKHQRLTCIGSTSHSMKSTDGLNFFHGNICHVALYDRALSSDDVWLRLTSANLNLQLDRILHAADAKFKASMNQLPNSMLMQKYLVQFFAHLRDLNKERVGDDRKKQTRKMVQGIIDELFRLRSCDGLVDLLRRLPADVDGCADFACEIFTSILYLDDNHFASAEFPLSEMPFKFSIVGSDMDARQIVVAAQIFRRSLLENLEWVKCLENDKLLVSLVMLGQDTKVVDLTEIDHIQDSDVCCMANNCGRSIRTLKMAGCDDITDAALAEIVRKCSFLEELELSNCRGISGDGVTSEMSPHLKTICLRGCPIGEDFLLSLVNTCCHLREIDLSGSIHVTNHVLEVLGLGLRNLVSLNVANCTIDDEGLEAFANAANASTLISINLSSCEDLTCRGVQELVRFPSLRYLHLNEVSKVSDEGLKPILCSCHSLEQLFLGSLDLLTDDCFDFSDHALRERILANVTEIHIDDCTGITNLGFVSSQCPQLRTLSASGIDLGDDEVCHLSHCIEIIKLARCTRISDTSVCALAKLQGLTEVDFSGCIYVTDDAIEELAGHCKLKTVSLARCRRLTDRSLKCLSRNPHMENIDVSGCKRITEFGVQELVSVSKSLQTLNISDCKHVSPQFAASISKSIKLTSK